MLINAMKKMGGEKMPLRDAYAADQESMNYIVNF